MSLSHAFLSPWHDALDSLWTRAWRIIPCCQLTHFTHRALHALPTLADQRQLPNECDWVVHVNINQMKQGDAGLWVLDKLAEEHEDTLRMLTLISGSDPMQDLSSIGIAGIAADQGTVFYATGQLNAKQLANLATMTTDHLTFTYRNFTVHKWFDANQGSFLYAALVPEAKHQRLLIADQQNSLQLFLDAAAQADASQGPQHLTIAKDATPQAAMRVWPAVPGLEDEHIRPSLTAYRHYAHSI